MVPLVGARRREWLEETLGALSVTLGPEDLAALERTVLKGAAAGDCYPAPQKAHLDSEAGHGGAD